MSWFSNPSYSQCHKFGFIWEYFSSKLQKCYSSSSFKKYKLPHHDLSSYGPLSNVNFLPKVLERIILSRINIHLKTFLSLCRFQSAYRKFHSTETALLQIYNNLLLASNKKEVSALVLLDLSAAFDTIVHQILLIRLSDVGPYNKLTVFLHLLDKASNE